MKQPPCFQCPNKGCGHQSECDKYMAFYQNNLERYEQTRSVSALNDYTKEAIRRAKSGAHSTLGKYRPKDVRDKHVTL